MPSCHRHWNLGEAEVSSWRTWFIRLLLTDVIGPLRFMLSLSYSTLHDMESSINADELSYFPSLSEFGSFPPKSYVTRGAIAGLDIGLMEIHVPAFWLRETLKQASAGCEPGTPPPFLIGTACVN